MQGFYKLRKEGNNLVMVIELSLILIFGTRSWIYYRQEERRERPSSKWKYYFSIISIITIGIILVLYFSGVSIVPNVFSLLISLVIIEPISTITIGIYLKRLSEKQLESDNNLS